MASAIVSSSMIVLLLFGCWSVIGRTVTFGQPCFGVHLDRDNHHLPSPFLRHTDLSRDRLQGGR